MLISKNFLTREASYKPSCLISWTHSGPEGGRATFDGWHGSMKPEGLDHGRRIGQRATGSICERVPSR